MIGIICWREHFRFVDVVDVDRLEDLRFREMSDAAFRHDRNAHRFLDALDHLRIAHARNATGKSDIGWDALERHNCASACFFSDPCLLWCRDVHDHATFQHLRKLLIQLGTFLRALARAGAVLLINAHGRTPFLLFISSLSCEVSSLSLPW